MIRAVLDTNVLVSALLSFPDAPAAMIYQAAKANRLVVVTPNPIFREVADVLGRERIATKYHLSPQRQQTLLNHLRQIAHVVTVRTSVSAVLADPDDNQILACALKGKAAFVITGDRHLLDLHQFHQIQIVTPREFVTILESPQPI